MSKTLHQIREAHGSLVKNYIEPSTIRELKRFAKQVSRAFQSSMEEVLHSINDKLEFFGYTLGELDFHAKFDDFGEQNYFVFTHADSETVRNLYITVVWEKLASGQQAPLGQGKSALKYDVAIDINEVSPDVIQSMVDELLVSSEGGDLDYFNPDEDSKEETNIEEVDEGLNDPDRMKRLLGKKKLKDKDDKKSKSKSKFNCEKLRNKKNLKEKFKMGDRVKHGDKTAVITHTVIPNRHVNVEYDDGTRQAVDKKHLKKHQRTTSLKESVKIKSRGRTLTVNTNDGGLTMTVNSDGSVSFGEITFPKNKAEQVVQSIQDHFIKYVS